MIFRSFSGDNGEVSHESLRIDRSPWRNWLARSAVNRKVGGSIPPGDDMDANEATIE